MALQVQIASLGAPGRTLLLDPRSLLVGEVIRDRKLLPCQSKRARVSDNERADDVCSVGRAEPPAHSGADVPAVGAVSGIAQSSHQFGECGSCPAHLPAWLPDGCREPKAGERRDDEVKRVARIATVRA